MGFRLALLLALLALPLAAAEGDDELRSQLDPAQVPRASGAANAYRILYVGDSITLHGTSAAVQKKLKWGHVAGMAASAEGLDYAHLLAGRIAAALPARTVEIRYHTLGGSGSAAQRLSAVAQVLPVAPHLVVVQLGEHEKEAAGAEAFRTSYRGLLAAFDQLTPRPLVVCTGVWNPYGKGTRTAYQGWPATLDRIMGEACAERGIAFVPVMRYALDPACSGSGESSGVQWHPNDQGHRGYADALFAAIAPALTR
ncbi:MAG: SGNH/GDSL hydrolase family protein [Planctomycetes bacterium]|nr:SGNH/GDSL hydrolase family protein [Planctomycetota bacterium]